MVKTTAEEFRARDMFDRLESAGDDTLEVVGLVRPHQEDDAVVYFALPGREDEWIPIPERLIRRFEALSTKPVAGGAHLVRLHLRQMEGQDVAVWPRLRAAQERGSPVGDTGAPSPAGAQYCYYDAEGRYICVRI